MRQQGRSDRDDRGAAPSDGSVRALSHPPAQRSHPRALLDAGVRILEHPAMLHAKAFLRDGNDVLAGTCNLEAWSLRRFFEIDLRVRSDQLAAQFDHRFSAPAEAVSVPGRAPTGAKRVIAKAFSTLAPVL
jgi:phosphatidylserine/phosphatidylglycerophosphate/cardiolipin synthase-like enzyme